MGAAGERIDGNQRGTPLLQDRSRLAIATLLATISGGQMSFTELQKRSGLTAGNLSSHLQKLERAEYLTVTKSFRGRRPSTTVAITESGRKALEDHIEQMERIVERYRSAAGNDRGNDAAVRPDNS